MDSEHELLLEDCYLVCVRPESPTPPGLESAEEDDIMCASHEEAEHLRQEFHQQGRSCIIRYIGPAGGGD